MPQERLVYRNVLYRGEFIRARKNVSSKISGTESGSWGEEAGGCRDIVPEERMGEYSTLLRLWGRELAPEGLQYVREQRSSPEHPWILSSPWGCDTRSVRPSHRTAGGFPQSWDVECQQSPVDRNQLPIHIALYTMQQREHGLSTVLALRHAVLPAQLLKLRPINR